MPSPTSPTSLYYPSAPTYAVGRPHAASATRRIPTLPRVLFYMLLTFNTLNLGAIYTQTIGSELPINPITFAVFAVAILGLTKRPRTRVAYFKAAWFFWIAYTIGGLLGPDQISFGSLQEAYRLAQLVLKIWICILGIPLLAGRVFDETSLPRYGKATTLLIGVGAALAIVQMLYPQSLVTITRGGGRGAGLWIDPNMGATMCAFGILVNLMFPFRSIVVNVGLRALMFCGLGATLSRGGILAALIALLVYGIMLGRWTAVLRTVVITVLMGIVGIAALEPLKESSIPGLAQRAEGIQQMLLGGVRGQTVQGRWGLWTQGFRYASKNWLRGRGHGSMNYAIKLVYLEHEGRWHSAGPHNYYIFVWGNSGLMALVAFFIFLGSMAWISLHSHVRRIRAGLMALLMVFMLLACSDHSLFAFQYFGAIFALFALAGHHARRRQPMRQPAMPQPAIGVATP